MKSLSTTILAGAVLSHCVATLQAFGPPSPATTYTFSTWSTRQEEPASFSFSLAMSLLEEDRENSLVRTDLLGGGSNATTLTAASASFGQVVPLKRPSTTTTTETNEYLIPSSSLPVVTDSLQQESRQRNLAVAVTSILLAISSYLWQFTHPITPVQLLFGMQQNSQPISVIGNNQKPTVVDFWAPWCENCKLIAPTLRQVEEEYKDRVNFVMVDGDKGESWPYIEAFGVDAIPHLALVSAEGDVETALIGPIPKHVLEADLDVLLDNAKLQQTQSSQPPQALPYRMLDVFARNPEGRRVHFQ
uniref:Thioredoxin domain-containing protein n=1 Tax=Entomoneis paludosa TaxID=265537 RepID=A0A7S2Y9T4_9STRA|mmetsp:Transcript_24107/g.50126  ORF Transcript_24107/g.50126 Transcript_24107/m.50126 type:complete len:303 (+) Transcript_24107:334-1242(+)|eukprot:CAMPEP_0172441504 /NCGR_PEP_ID=MMETSP1065-20121228/2056_1 /TAXON_ID=265537 /ORGANISM="Amphiprora paludosa, Strain CCMP125" /LENGTH=302 /DNA_ID=CAMNT_0013190919 /DNA_START=285 /DNA_END=1193 /DNA_ORIENTATION=+